VLTPNPLGKGALLGFFLYAAENFTFAERINLNNLKSPLTKGIGGFTA
jgi:hypothetical protein